VWLDILRREASVPALDQRCHCPESLRWLALRLPRVQVVNLTDNDNSDNSNNSKNTKKKKNGRIVKFKHVAKEMTTRLDRLEHVRELNFNGNEEVTSEIVLALVSSCPNVQKISLESLGQTHEIEDAEIAAIGRLCPKLRALNLSQLNVGSSSYCSFSSFAARSKTIEAIAKGCEFLEELDLEAYSLIKEADFVDVGAHCAQLKTLHLHMCSVTPNALCHLSRCSLLEDVYFDVDLDNFDAASWERGMLRLVAGCAGLRRLSLVRASPGVVGAIAHGCRNLEELMLVDKDGEAGLTGAPAGSFSDALAGVARCCERLSVVQLARGAADDRGLFALAQGRCRLREVHLDGCSNLTGRGVAEFLDALETSLDHIAITDIADVGAIFAALRRKHRLLTGLTLERVSIPMPVQPVDITSFLLSATHMTGMGLHRLDGLTQQHVSGWRRHFPQLQILATTLRGASL
jgi:hypothetical protein